MDSFLFRFRNALVLVLLLVAQTIGLAIQVRRPAALAQTIAPLGGSSLASTAPPEAESVTLARSWVVGVVSPIERLVHNTGLLVRSTWTNYLDLRHTRANNAALRRDLDQLRIEQAAIAEDAIQGHRLQALLQFQQHYAGSTIAAQVIGSSGSDLSRVVYIDKGAADGIRPDMAVITPDGIVGKVRDVFPTAAPHTAQVLLLSDQTSGAGVVLQQTRLRAVLRGATGGELQITNLTDDDHLKPGDAIVTSGGDGIFPRGLPVGAIASFAPDPGNAPYFLARVRPAANLSRLEEVLVVTGTESALPPATLATLAHGAMATQQARAAAAKAAADRAAAEEAAHQEAARSAAEIVADRLPSIHDANDPNTADPSKVTDADAAAATAKTAVDPKKAGAVPKPLPTIHADRYSPGATPPAVRLAPGTRPTSATTGAPHDAVPPANPDTSAPPSQP